MKKVLTYCALLASLIVNIIAMPSALAETTEVTLPYDPTGKLTKTLDVGRNADVHVVKFSGGGVTTKGIARVLEITPNEHYIIPAGLSDCRIPVVHGQGVYSRIGLAFVYRENSDDSKDIINTIFDENTANAAITACNQY